jgi:hypothetical protein
MSTVTKVPLCFSYKHGTKQTSWADEIVEMLRGYIRGEPVFIEFTGSDDSRRTGSIARLYINDLEMQNILHGGPDQHGWGYLRTRAPRTLREVDEKYITNQSVLSYRGNYRAKWDGRRQEFDLRNGWSAQWLKGYDPAQGTLWKWEKPAGPPAVVPKDKLGRDIQVGDFISYILYHFDNSRNAAGIYYGKVTKIDKDGTVHAKNIKLKDTDVVDEKRIKDNSLIVIMSKDLMDKLMLARLSIF